MASNTDCDHQAFLENFFQHIGHFSFDKAKEMAEKEKEKHKAEVGSSWMLIVTSLCHFCSAERMYSSLTFLSQKWFSRPKENPRSAYTALNCEFRKATDGETTTSKERILSHICGQMCDFLMARHKMMDFYEQMLTIANVRNVDQEDLLIVITEIISNHRSNFHHPILGALKSSFTYECDIIFHLLQAQKHMAMWKFLPSLLQLHEAHSKLISWGAPTPSLQVKKTFGMTGSKMAPYPALYIWLQKFMSCLHSKFGLYFHDILSKQTTPAEMKSLCARSPDDLTNRIIGLHKKTDAYNTSLILEVDESCDEYEGCGYCHPLRKLDPPQGIDCYKAIFSYPNDKPQNHWPQIVMMISSSLGSNINKVHYVYDETNQMTYFLCHIECQMWIVILFPSKKSEKDSYINNFLSDFTSQLRCTKLFSNLKPGVK